MKMLDLDPRKNPPDPVQIIPRTTKKLTCEPPSHPISSSHDFLLLMTSANLGPTFGKISSCLAEKFVGKFRGMVSGGFPSFNPNEWNHIPKITGKFSPTLKSRSQCFSLFKSVVAEKYFTKPKGS